MHDYGYLCTNEFKCKAPKEYDVMLHGSDRLTTKYSSKFCDLLTNNLSLDEKLKMVEVDKENNIQDITSDVHAVYDGTKIILKYGDSKRELTDISPLLSELPTIYYNIKTNKIRTQKEILDSLLYKKIKENFKNIPNEVDILLPLYSALENDGN